MPSCAGGSLLFLSAAWLQLAMNFCFQLKSDRTVVVWGDNDHAQPTLPVWLWLRNLVAIAGGDFYSLALKLE